MRRRPYADKGIKRVPCARCGRPSSQQWKVCALGRWDGICVECDIELNRLVLKFIGIPSKEISCIMDEYEYKVRGRVGQKKEETEIHNGTQR